MRTLILVIVRGLSAVRHADRLFSFSFVHMRIFLIFFFDCYYYYYRREKGTSYRKESFSTKTNQSLFGFSAMPIFGRVRLYCMVEEKCIFPLLCLGKFSYNILFYYICEKWFKMIYLQITANVWTRSWRRSLQYTNAAFVDVFSIHSTAGILSLCLEPHDSHPSKYYRM